jgi:hypothetical protein
MIRKMISKKAIRIFKANHLSLSLGIMTNYIDLFLQAYN